MIKDHSSRERIGNTWQQDETMTVIITSWILQFPRISLTASHDYKLTAVSCSVHELMILIVGLAFPGKRVSPFVAMWNHFPYH